MTQAEYIAQALKHVGNLVAVSLETLTTVSSIENDEVRQVCTVLLDKLGKDMQAFSMILALHAREHGVSAIPALEIMTEARDKANKYLAEHYKGSERRARDLAAQAALIQAKGEVAEA